MAELNLNLLTPRRLDAPEDGRQVLNLLGKIYPDLSPERYGSYEPLKQVFDIENPDAALSDWHRMFFWKRRRPKVEGAVSIAWTPHPLHAWMSLSIDSTYVDQKRFLLFVEDSFVELSADFASINYLVEQDVAFGVSSGTLDCIDPKKLRYVHSVTTHILKKYLPDIYWVTVFGPAYVKFFGRERLLSCPAPVVRELKNGSILLQLSADFREFETHYDDINLVRLGVKRHLGMNAFFDFSLPASHVYQTPTFVFS